MGGAEKNLLHPLDNKPTLCYNILVKQKGVNKNDNLSSIGYSRGYLDDVGFHLGNLLAEFLVGVWYWHSDRVCI